MLNFYCRDYVLAAREKDISQNWPFPEKYLRTCIVHGITTVLPPFEPARNNSEKNPSYREEENSGFADKEEQVHNGVDFNRKQETIEVNIDVSTSNAIPKSDYQIEDHCLTTVPSSKKLKYKRKKHKRKHKMRLMSDIIAKAKPCTLEELDKINGSNWTVDQPVVYRGTITSDADKVNGSMKTTTQDNRGTRSAENFQKTKQLIDEDNTENDDVVVKKRWTPKIKLNGRCKLAKYRSESSYNK